MIPMIAGDSTAGKKKIAWNTPVAGVRSCSAKASTSGSAVHSGTPISSTAVFSTISRVTSLDRNSR